jgi:hypothetical protein
MSWINFGSGNQMDFNKQETSWENKKNEFSSHLILYFFKSLLVVGLFLMVFDSAGYITKGSYFGQYNWVTGVVFLIGTFLSYIAVPYLYYSSFNKYKINDDFWDQEMFWILPIFFFANFFQYGSGIFFMLAAMIISVFIIFTIHARFMMLSKKIAENTDSYEKKNLYYENMKYLTIYYLLLLILCFFFNPARGIHSWIANNI